MIEFTVVGLPAPQGSKRFVGHAKSGRGILVESSRKVKPWREAVKYAALETGKRISGPVTVLMVFALPRPASAPQKRRFPDRKPDLSKLIRSTEDAISDSGTWEDDARVIMCVARKVYAGSPGEMAIPGVRIRIEEAI